MDAFLSIDLGTTGLKVSLAGVSGELIASEYVEYPITSPQAGYAEQDPGLWWSGLVQCCNKLGRGFPKKMGHLLGIGICGQMHTQVYLNGAMENLRPSITWMDQRSSPIVSRINQNPETRALVFRETKNFATTTYTAPQVKWVQENQPDLWSHVSHILLAKDFIKYRLTGEMTTDYSDAAGTLLFDVEQCRWSEEMFRLFDFSPNLFPQALPSDEIVGRVSMEAFQQTGLPEGTPVTNGCADHSAATLGAGVHRPGQVSAVIGTAGVISVCSDRPLPDNKGRTLCWNYCLRNRWEILGVMQTAGESLHWFKNAFDPASDSDDHSSDVFEEYNRSIDGVPDGSDGLIFLPYLNGERTPYWDPDARGVFFGIGLSTGKAHFIKAIMEGVSFGMRNNVETVEDLGITVDEIRLIGGASKSPVWLGILGKVLRKTIKTIRVKDAGLLGSIILCGRALDVYPSVEDAIESMVISDQEISASDPHPVYENQYGLFLDLYENLKETFAKAARGSP
jgi:xylulokinase